MQSQNKSEVSSLIHEHHKLLRKGDRKAGPEKTSFFLKNGKFMQHVVSCDLLQPIAEQVRNWKVSNHRGANLMI